MRRSALVTFLGLVKLCFAVMSMRWRMGWRGGREGGEDEDDDEKEKKEKKEKGKQGSGGCKAGDRPPWLSYPAFSFFFLHENTWLLFALSSFKGLLRSAATALACHLPALDMPRLAAIMFEA